VVEFIRELGVEVFAERVAGVALPHGIVGVAQPREQAVGFTEAIRKA
jgi:hypothetical protein